MNNWFQFCGQRSAEVDEVLSMWYLSLWYLEGTIFALKDELIRVWLLKVKVTVTSPSVLLFVNIFSCLKRMSSSLAQMSNDEMIRFSHF